MTTIQDRTRNTSSALGAATSKWNEAVQVLDDLRAVQPIDPEYRVARRYAEGVAESARTYALDVEDAERAHIAAKEQARKQILAERDAQRRKLIKQVDRAAAALVEANRALEAYEDETVTMCDGRQIDRADFPHVGVAETWRAAMQSRGLL